MRQTLLLALASFFLFGCTQTKQADLVIHNAIIYTLDDAFSTAEAIAIKDGKVVEVGAEHQILNAYAAKEKVDARQAVVFPGWIDAHSHFLGYALQQDRVDLIGTASYDEVVQRIQAYIESHDSKWVLGRGWDQNDWEQKEFPTNDTLNKLFPNHFIALKRVDGHAILVTDNVLELAEIDASTIISGGKVLMKDDQPTGVLIDAAADAIDEIIPDQELSTKANAMINAQASLFEHGLTSVCDAGLKTNEVALIDSLHRSGDLKVRVYAMYSASKELLTNMMSYEIMTDKLTARSIKVYADGALGSRGARLLEPYADDTNNLGLVITPQDSVSQWAEACYKANFQLNVHCIGDGANRMVLDAMGQVLNGTNDRRWRIEHAQVVHPEDREKFGRFNILPSMQPTHTTSDMYWAEERLGDHRIHYAYCLRSLMKENGLIPLGTDFPVEGIDPLATFYAATARKDAEGYPPGGFGPEESLSREEAMRGMTIWAALANFEEETRGSLEPGKFADLVMVDRDLISCEESEILETEVLKTWLGGELVYEK